MDAIRFAGKERGKERKEERNICALHASHAPLQIGIGQRYGSDQGDRDWRRMQVLWQHETGLAVTPDGPGQPWNGWGMSMSEARERVAERERQGGAALSVIPSWILLVLALVTPTVTAAIGIGINQATVQTVQSDIRDLKQDVKATVSLGATVHALESRLERIERHLDTQDRQDGRASR